MTERQMTIERVAIDAVHPHPRNAREGDVGAISESIRANGIYKPLVVQRSTGAILAGNHTWKACRALGHQTVEVVYADVDDERALRILLADNRTSDQATYDDHALARLLEELRPTSEGLAGTGYDGDALDDLLAEIGKPLRLNLDEAPPAPAAPKTRTGDLYEMGDHRLLCGDSTRPEDIERLTEKKPVACIITDPPYAIYGSSTGVSSDVADDKMVRPFFEALFRNAYDHLDWFGHMYVCCDWRSWAAIWDSAKRGNLTPKNLLVWDKGGSGLGSNYANTYELVGFFHKLQGTQSMTAQRKAGIRGVLRPNVLRVDRARGDDRQHNAAKPVELMCEFIENSTDKGGRVLDLFGGSGSTLIACEQKGRAALLMEIEPKWCDVIVARWEKLTGNTAKKVAAGAA